MKRPRPTLAARPTAARPANLPRLPGRRRWARRAGLVALAVVLLLGLVELGLRAGGYGYPTHFFVPLPGGGGFITNRCFAWHFFERPTAPRPLPAVLPAAKAEGALRVIILGEDVALGTPDPAYSFGRVLEMMLGQRHPGRRFEFVNAALPGIDSTIVRAIAEDCARYQPDLFIVAMGHNEVIGPHGPRATTPRWSAPGLGMTRTGARVREFRLGQLLDGLLAPAPRAAPAEWTDPGALAAYRLPPDDPRRQAAYGPFRTNLSAIITAGRAAGARVVVGTVASNLKDCPPFSSAHRPDLPDADKARWQAAYTAGVALEEAGHHADAVERYRDAERIDDRYAELHYRLAHCCQSLQRPDDARRHFARARDTDALPLRADARLNDIVHEIAGGRESEGVSLVDVERTLEQGAAGTPGDELFWDHTHLRFAGSYAVARALLAPAEAALGLDAPAGDPPSLERCAEQLAETPFDRRRCAEAVLLLTARPPFTGQLDHEKRQAAQVQALAGMVVAGPELARSIEVYSAAVARRPDDWLLHANFAQLLTAASRPAEATEHLEAVVKALPGDLQARLGLAANLIDIGKPEEAAGRFRDILAADPQFDRAHKGLGDALAGQGQRDQALVAYDAALRLNPADIDALSNRGMVRLAQGDATGARADFEAALKLGPDPESARRLGTLLLNQGQPAEALPHLQRAARIRPADVPSQNNCGLALLALGRAGEAAERFRAAVERNPNYAQAHAALAQVEAARGRAAEADAYRRRAAERGYDRPGHLEVLAESLTNLGSALLAQGDKAGARACFQSTRGFTVHAEAEYRLGTLLLDEGKPAEALAHLQRACLLKPADGRPQYSCGAALMALGRTDEAAERFAAAVQAAPHDGAAHAALAQAHMNRGRHAEAIWHFRKAIELKHNPPLTLGALAWLLATAPDAKLRDGPVAVRLAEDACRQTGRRNVNCLDALTAAYAEVGRFDDALRTAREALAVAESTGAADLAAVLRQRIPILEAHRPLHP